MKVTSLTAVGKTAEASIGAGLRGAWFPECSVKVTHEDQAYQTAMVTRIST
jgi:hypothetical protein